MLCGFMVIAPHAHHGQGQEADDRVWGRKLLQGRFSGLGDSRMPERVGAACRPGGGIEGAANEEEGDDDDEEDDDTEEDDDNEEDNN